ERTRRALTLEGLAHFELGMARTSLRDTKNSDARDAFYVARETFKDALKPTTNAPAVAIASDWQSAFSSGATPVLTGLPADAQSALIASFHGALAQYWHAIAPSQEVTLDVDRRDELTKAA